MAYRIDLTPNASYTETVSVSQDDVGREIAVDLYLDGTAYTPTTGTTITMQGTKPSGLGYTITGTASGSTVTFLTTLEMTQEAGRFASEIVLTNGNTVIGTANFALYVEKNPHPENTIDGTGETMQNLTVRMDALEDDVAALESATDVPAGYVPTADGQDGWSWEAQSGGGLTDGIKQALLQIAQKVAYIDEDGQDYYDALEGALYPPATLVSISAVYTQSGTVYDTDSLDDLKSDLVVTAIYDNGTSKAVTTYALSGSLVTGESIITVTYGGKTATFTVLVTGWLTSISAIYTQSGTVYDNASLNNLKEDLVVTANYADGTSSVVTEYTLSGTLEEGTSVVTVTYSGKTATFNVTVSHSPYVEYRYLNVTGAEYIDTNFSETDIANCGIDYKITLGNVANTSGHIFSAANNYIPFVRLISGSYQYFMNRAGRQSSVASEHTVGDEIQITAYKNREDKVFADGNLIATVTKGSTAESESNYYTFFAYGSSHRYQFVGKLHYFKIFDSNDVLIHHFVPAMSEIDNKCGLLDKITSTLYESTSGTPFTVSN